MDFYGCSLININDYLCWFTEGNSLIEFKAVPVDPRGPNLIASGYD